MPDIVKKRRRPAVSCTLCRRRKIKCDRVLPCRNCVKSGNPDCTFDADTVPPVPAAEAHHHHQLQSPPLSTPSPSHTSLQTAPATHKWIKHHPESGPCTPATINTATSSIGGVVHMHIAPTAVGHGTQTKSIMHKSRVFGQSYWFNGVAPMLLTLEIMEPLIHHGAGSPIIESLQKCKTLGRQVKQCRTPSWPCALSTALPDRAVADALLDNYLRTSESVYRIIHIPTFKQAYESLWISGGSPPLDSFLVQLKLIMAIGAVTYDDCFSMRSDAMRWIYEAKTWLSDPRSKSKPSIQMLQVNILLLVAQELLHVEGDPTWVATGAIVRRAMHFGLHRDPETLVTMSIFAAETRRRLWNTILELAVQSALASGGAPLVSLDDFDTKPPGNYDDEDLLSGTPVAKPMSEFTSSSISIILRSTFAARLAVTRHLNDLASTGHYQETMRIDTDLKEIFKTMRRSIQQYMTNGTITRSHFEVNLVEVIANRYVSALHVPFYSASLRDPGYSYSRQTVVGNSLKIWRATYADPGRPEPVLARWALCGMGFFRLMAMQASLLIPLELRAQMEDDDDSLGAKSPRQDLLDVVRQGVDWSRRCLEIGGTNIKGYLLAAVVGAHVNSIANGVEKANIPQIVLQTAEVTVEHALQLLEKSLETEQQRRERADAQVVNTAWEAGDVDVGFSTGDWDALMSEALLQVGDGDPMGWLLEAAGGGATGKV